jgi:RNA polymerase II subunit A small phosphatase-like protein
MPNASRDPLLILDLDETLIHATESALSTPHDFKAGPYFVHRRPFLESFLATVATAYQLAVWSSSSDDYVATVTRHIFPAEIPLQFEWSRSRCVNRYHPEWQERYFVKDLRKVQRLGYDLKRMLIVDDTPQKLERNYGNAIYVKSFEGDPADDELQHLAPYLLSLAGHENLRAIEKRGWRR